MIRILLFLLFGILLTSQAEAQIYSQLYTGKQEMFLEAESFHLFEEFNEALPLYLELLKDDPDNAFLNYRAGTSYLGIPGEKERAIDYLEKAIENLDDRERRPTFRTTKAPPDAVFFLANAYHLNYEFEKSLEFYYQFRETMDRSTYNIDVVNEHIQAVLNTMESMNDKVFFLEENLGERINTRFSETNPVVSGDKNVLVFTRKMQFYDGVFFSQRGEDGGWLWPMEITPQIGSDGDCYPVSLSYDGKELYLYKSDDLVGNIYVSYFIDGQWTLIRKLNGNINTSYWESHASVSRDGNTLYFTSNRPGGFGGLDIYYSKRNSSVKPENDDHTGNWGPAVNIGPTINTPYNEDTPFITEDGQTLYFSSLGHYNIGGYDVLYSTRLDEDTWSEPVNVGYGVSTPDDDLFFHPAKNGIFAYVSKFDNLGFGETDIYRYEFFSDANPRKFTIQGLVSRKDGLQTGPQASIKFIDAYKRDTVHRIRPHQITGEYEISVEPGEWELVFREKGHDDIVKRLDLPLDRIESEIRVDAVMARTEPELPEPEEIITDSIIIPEEYRKPKTLGIEQHHQEITQQEEVSVPMRLERNTILEVERYVDGELVETEKITVDRRRFNYDFTPDPGNNELIFRYKDNEGEVITERVSVTYQSDEIEMVTEEIPPDDNVELIISKYQDRYYSPKEFIDSLLPRASSELALFLKELIEEERVPETNRELIELIMENSEEYGFEKWELSDILAKQVIEQDIPPPVEDPETEDGKTRIWWILVIAILLIAAYFYKERFIKTNNSPDKK
jgi:tetratricopeptide (TPR) repeat protein